MATNSRNDLLQGLRSKIADERASVPAFSISVVAQSVKSAFLSISNGFLDVNVDGAGAESLHLPLNLPDYATVGRLFTFLAKLKGYSVTAGALLKEHHASTNLAVVGYPNIKESGYMLSHQTFSDEELMRFLDEAVAVHNPNYSITTVPRQEYMYVTLKAASTAYRAWAAEFAKRKELEAQTATFLDLAKDLENQYFREREAHARTLPAPKVDESKVGQGDIMQGRMSRPSLRGGYTSAYRTEIPPMPPVLFEPADDDVEDTYVRLRWSQAREQTFSHYEVWRDTTPNVERNISGRLARSNTPSAELPINTPYSRGGTSRQVLGINGAIHIAPVFDGFFFWSAGDFAGASLVNATFTDGFIYNSTASGNILGEPVEPETDYYYRVYGINRNGEVCPSGVRKYRTKAMRAKFARLQTAPQALLLPDFISPNQGPLAGGTLITVKGTRLDIPGVRLEISGKPCAIQSVTATEITALTPGFVNPDFIQQGFQVVLVSPNGLRDIATNAWTYTP